MVVGGLAGLAASRAEVDPGLRVLTARGRADHVHAEDVRAAFGDVRVAAELVGVHHNTLRYRLRRLAAFDLDDPVERFDLQLRLLSEER